MDTAKFATAITCIDGRVQVPVIDYMKAQYSVDYVDLVTESGPVGVIVEHRDLPAIDAIKRRVDVSKMRHGSKILALVAHHDCAANQITREAQIEQLRTAISQHMNWWGFWETLTALWVDETWRVIKII